MEYTPREVGIYKIEAFRDGIPVTKNPFSVEVCDPSKVRLVNVNEGVIGREQRFRVDSTRAGRGDMTVTIRSGDTEVHHAVKEVSAGVFDVCFTPQADRPHYLDIRYNGYHIPSCPRLVEIRDPKQTIIVHGQGLKSCVPKSVTSFLIETGGFAAAKDFDIIITDPVGSPLPVKCYQQKDGSLVAEYVPQYVGSHKIDVLYLDAHVSGSPFVSEAFDATKVVLQRIRTTNYVLNEKISFCLSRKDAGYAELDVTVTSPLGRHLPIEVTGTPDNEGEVVEFIPTAVGKYKIAITFGTVEVPGSPLTFIVSEGTFPTIDGSGVKFGFVNDLAHFLIDARGLHGVPEVKVDGPETEPKVTIHEENGIFKATYLPAEVGVFDVRVTWNGRDMPGSPFHPQIVDLNKVRPIGGWENLLDSNKRVLLVRNEDKKVSFDTQGAGPGKVRASIKFPDGEIGDAVVEQTSAHKFRLTIPVRLDGEYSVSLYFADHLLPVSPITCYTHEPHASSSSSNGHAVSADCATVVLRGHGLAGARVGEETEFVIDGNDAGNGQPEITLTGVKADIPIRVTQVKNNVFKATYTPSVQGQHLLFLIPATAY